MLTRVDGIDADIDLVQATIGSGWPFREVGDPPE
jgi:hypothetical protein